MGNINLNIDFKMIIIFALLGLSLFFGYKWHTSSDLSKSEWKSRVDQLTKENKILKSKRDSISILIVDLREEYNIISERESILKEEIENLEKEITDARKRISITYKNLDELKNKLENNKKRIDTLVNNPQNKSEEDLLESLKNNLKL